MKKYRFLLGFDPSLDGTGYCVLDCNYKTPRVAEVGTIKGRTKSWNGASTPVKLSLIQAKVKELRAKYDPIYPKVFLESGFVKFNSETKAVYKARGALESELVGLEIIEYTPSTIKKTVTGNGHASKEEVKKAIEELFNISIKDNHFDESDAIAVAFTGYLNEYKRGNEDV